MNKDTIDLLKLMQEKIDKTGVFCTRDAIDSDKINNDTINKSYEYLEKKFQLENKGQVMQRTKVKKFFITEIPIEAIELLNQTMRDKLINGLIKYAPIMSLIMFLIVVFKFILSSR